LHRHVFHFSQRSNEFSWDGLGQKSGRKRQKSGRKRTEEKEEKTSAGILDYMPLSRKKT